MKEMKLKKVRVKLVSSEEAKQLGNALPWDNSTLCDLCCFTSSDCPGAEVCNESTDGDAVFVIDKWQEKK